MPRFFVEEENIKDNIISLYGDDAGHISRVLRSKTGDMMTVCDGSGNDYEAAIIEISDNTVKLEIKNTTYTESEPAVKIILFQGLPKGDKMELIIQKCVELGVYSIIPVNTERCIVKLDKNKEKKKIERWQKVSESAAKQSGRGIVPQIGEVMSFGEALKKASQLDMSMIPYELERDRGLKEFLDDYRTKNGRTLGIFIGPEGGFAFEEIEKALNSGILPVTLGKRILRTETAGMTAVANTLFYLDM
ncbi:Ribosomal RNA small subunit methyltransferase E [bioreactor metagenome]|uniref:16S rRNA (uracil(1498)-N(3))-methyltransferase n=1 Tax=bioreactor metagenome TaxID=1076179 RepID=A0A644XSX0_9ZZZZ|nr:16S rRNA (uracil(1498)-N(3))-methyltransferase [Candidatus Metalachnospira sp.]